MPRVTVKYPTVIVTVENGVVNSVYSTASIDVIVVDLDGKELTGYQHVYDFSSMVGDRKTWAELMRNLGEEILVEEDDGNADESV